MSNNTSFDALVERIKSLSQLEPNWDGAAAEAPNRVAIAAAETALGLLLQSSLLPDFIAPSSEHGIGFTFQKGLHFGHIEFFNDGDVCVLVDYNGQNPKVWEFPASDPTLLRESLDLVKKHFEGLELQQV